MLMHSVIVLLTAATVSFSCFRSADFSSLSLSLCLSLSLSLSLSGSFFLAVQLLGQELLSLKR